MMENPIAFTHKNREFQLRYIEPKMTIWLSEREDAQVIIWVMDEGMGSLRMRATFTDDFPLPRSLEEAAWRAGAALIDHHEAQSIRESARADAERKIRDQVQIIQQTGRWTALDNFDATDLLAEIPPAFE